MSNTIDVNIKIIINNKYTKKSGSNRNHNVNPIGGSQGRHLPQAASQLPARGR